MYRLLLSPLPLLILQSVLWAEDNPKELKPAPASGYQALMAEYKNALKEADANFRKTKTNEERQTIRANFHKWRIPFVGRVLAFAESHPKDKDVLLALFFVLHPDIHAERRDLDKATSLILKDHVTSDRLVDPPILPLLAIHESAIAETPLRVVLRKNTHHAVQAHACASLAQILKEKAVGGNREEAAKLIKEAEELFQRVVEKYSDVPKAARIAKAELFQIQHLAIGKAIPDIKGTDSTNKDLRLSDYRGKVVVVYFWASWCRACMQMVPHERSLVQRTQGKPLILIGVNLDESREICKKTEEKNQITWRSFCDGRHGPIREEFNPQSMATNYVLDGKGIIRFKNVHGEAMDKAVDQLLAELEKEKETKRIQ